MQSKQKVLISIVLTIILLAAAVLIWANQTHRITIWGAGGETPAAYTISNISLMNNYIEVGTEQVTAFQENHIYNIDPKSISEWTWTAQSLDDKLTINNASNASGGFSLLNGQPLGTAELNLVLNTKNISSTVDTTYSAGMILTIKKNGQIFSTSTLPMRVFFMEHKCVVQRVSQAAFTGAERLECDKIGKFIVIRYGKLDSETGYENVIFWSDGIVTKEAPGIGASNGTTIGTILTCYTKEEMDSLMNLAEQLGTWSLYYPPPILTTYPIITGPIDSSSEYLTITKRGTNMHLSSAPASLMKTIETWPDDKTSRVYTSCSKIYSPPVATSSVNDTQPPTAPTNLKATSNSSTQITITWTPSTGDVPVTSYILYNATTNAYVAGFPSLNDNINDNKIVLSNLTPNTPYKYYLKAYDAKVKESIASDIITITTPAKDSDSSTSGSVTSNSSGTSSGGATSTSGSSKTTGTEKLSIAKLVSTGQALWFNILIAMILSGIVLYLGFKKPKGEGKNEF